MKTITIGQVTASGDARVEVQGLRAYFALGRVIGPDEMKTIVNKQEDSNHDQTSRAD